MRAIFGGAQEAVAIVVEAVQRRDRERRDHERGIADDVDGRALRGKKVRVGGGRGAKDESRGGEPE
jgi:hypothetical protein